MKRYFRNLAYLSFVFFGAVGCAEAIQEPSAEELGTSPLSPLAVKAINTSAGATEDELLLYMDDSQDLVPVLEALDVKSYSRAIPDTGNDEKLARYGLDKWYVVDLKPGTSLVNEAERIACCPQVRKIQFNKLLSRETDVTFPAELTPQTRSVAADVFSQFDDPYFNQQWHFINVGDKKISPDAVAGADINVKDAWKLTTGDSRVVVAVLDAGVKYSHPDLADNMWVNEKELNGLPGVDDDGNGYVDDIHGYNFVADTCAISWQDSHGTHVAGTISAVNNNGIGVSSIAGGSGNDDGVRIMTCQIIDGNTGGATLQVGRAAYYAAENGASIIQGSFGFMPDQIKGGDDEYEADYAFEYKAYQYFMNEAKGCDALKGGVIIMAAGNDAAPRSAYPAAHRDIISVTATAIDGLPASYTNFGPGSNITAPGGESTAAHKSPGVLSTIPSDSKNSEGKDYAFKQGTSMSCPHVSGVAALGLSYALKVGKSFTPQEFKGLLLSSVSEINSRLEGYRMFNGTKIPLEMYRDKMGTGCVDAWRLLMAIDGTPCIQVRTEADEVVDLRPYMGGDAAYLKYLTVTYENGVKDILGLENKPMISNGRLKIRCNKAGSAKITIKAIAGGSELGNGKIPGGSDFVREISIVSRYQNASQNGGWL